jgi:hypothetical protein
MGGDDGLEEDAFFSCVERWLSMKKQGEETSGWFQQEWVRGGGRCKKLKSKLTSSASFE